MFVHIIMVLKINIQENGCYI